MKVSEFLGSLIDGFGTVPAPALLVMAMSVAVIVGLPVIWKGWLERLIEMKRKDRVPVQEERDWDWMERLKPLEREFERKSNLDAVRTPDAGEDIDPIADLRRLLAEYKNPAEEDK